MAEEISLARMVQAGVIPMDTSSAIAEIKQKSVVREDPGPDVGPFFPVVTMPGCILYTSDAKVYPSSPNQKVLGAQIAEEMKAMGLTDVIQDEYGYVAGMVPMT